MTELVRDTDITVLGTLTEGRCPCCEGHYEHGFYMRNSTGQVQEAVLHTRPRCKQYDDLSAEDYLALTRKAAVN